MTSAVSTTPSTVPRRDLALPPPRWAYRAAHAAALTTLPSGLWRLALAAGLPVGYSPDAARALFDAPGRGSWYLVALSVVLEALALLTLGLVQPWGEVVPRWVPVLGGKRIPPLAAVIPAATGTLALTVLWGTVAVSWWFTNGDGALSPPARMAVGVLYVPLAAWGPLLGAVTYSYYQRHRGGTQPEATRDVSLD